MLKLQLLFLALTNYALVAVVMASDSFGSDNVPITNLSNGQIVNNFVTAANVAADKRDDNVDLNGKLVFAHVLYRHGDRTPVDPYPNDPWKDVKYWPTGLGQLTEIGINQHYQLGQWLRKRYDSILNRTYSNDEIYVRSTDVDRTLMSALSNLAGLYPPVDNQIWNKDLLWQPIPVHTVPENIDYVLAAKAKCPAYEYAMKALFNSPEFQQINDRYAYLYDYLTQNTGRTINSLQSVEFLNNTLLIESLYNRTLPEWTKKVFPGGDMAYISDLSFKVLTYTRHMARLRMGSLVKEILERFNDKARGSLTPDRSVWIYSAHDTTVASVLNTLNLFELHSPPYTACILMELRIDDKRQPFVSIFYKNTTDEPKPMYIPNCGTACPLKKMFNLYNDILPIDWKQECHLATMMLTYEDANIGLAMGILVIIIIVMLMISYVAMIYYRRREYTYSAYSQVA